MENPGYWTKAEHLINKVMSDYADNVDKGIIGSSLPSMIYKALVEAKFIQEQERPEFPDFKILSNGCSKENCACKDKENK